MKKYNYICLLFCAMILGACSKENKTVVSDETIRKELKELIRRGYSIEELEIRTNCSSQKLYRALFDKSSLKEHGEIIDSIYSLDKEGKLISASKIGFSAKECVHRIFVKAQNLPIASQYTGISVVSLCNELTNRQPFAKEDSLRAMVAYIDNLYGYAQIPTNIDVKPYFTDYYNEHNINTVKMPLDYSKNFEGATPTQYAILNNFVEQAEKFELIANNNLEKNINQLIDLFIDDVSQKFINDDAGFLNAIKLYFDSDEEKEAFYIDKLKNRIKESDIDSLIRSEIINYCISINCSRELAVNEMLSYRENISNMDIASKTKLSNNLHSINALHYTGREKIEALNRSVSMLISVGAIFLTKNPTKLWSIGKNIVSAASAFNSASLKKIAKEKDQENCQELETFLKDNLRKNIMKQLKNNPDGYYKKALDENTKAYFEKLRNDLKIY